MEGFMTTHPALSAIAARIQPDSIPFLPHLDHEGVGNFGKKEIEVNAGGIIRYFRERGKWEPFDVSDLKAFYKRTSWPVIIDGRHNIFYGLAGDWFDDGSFRAREDPRFLRLCSDGSCMVTDRFILRCAGRHPDEISAITREAA